MAEKQSSYEKYVEVASRLFRDFVETKIDKFRWVHPFLRQANMGIMLREYICLCFLNALITPAIALPITYLYIILLGKPFLLALVLSLAVTAVLTAGIFVGSLYYPKMVAAERKKDIENNLPFATLYMNTIAGTGAPPFAMFKLLADFKEYGEVSKEAQKIVEDVEVMGRDIDAALHKAAEQTPSDQFKEMLLGISTTIVGGGNLRVLLSGKSKILMNEYRRKIEKYTNELSIYIELYITLVIVGSIFSTVMLTIMGSISGFESFRFLQQALVYIFLPVAGIVMIGLLKIASPL
ncbi:TPA: type II secretion system F family protein [archaeon]|jgi:flagellar protein FlaJ|uniref:Type II secretion system F family protein n=1 Tax=Candidatus Undinarchaeum marinum TaxID=2756141 RepID=A0A832XIH3_9ARCH|nr:type II secretion system F family protein [Candidatus Undinarchaeum marinum]